MNRRAVRILIKTSLALIALVIVVGYALYSSKNFVVGPTITLTTPEDGTLVSTSTVIVQGIAKNVKDISLNGQPIVIDEQGNFREITLANIGYNVFSLSAHDRFGRGTEKLFHLIYTRQ